MRIRKVSQTPIPSDTAEIIDGYSTSPTNGYSCNYANEAFGGTILWTNSSPTSNFTNGTINLSSSDYDCIEIIYRLSTTRMQTKSTGIIPKGYGSILEFVYNDGSTNLYNSRFISYSSSTSLYSENCYTTQGSSADNSRLIPLYVIGYKKGLFS